MSKHRIYVEHLPTGTAEFELEPQTAHYARQVLRLGDGDSLMLFNGQGLEWQALLLGNDQKSVRVQLVQQIEATAESPLSIVLVQGISRGERMDYSLQKATELGVARIQPVFCQRSEVKLQGSRLEKRHSHWQSVVISACEQSTRATVPRVDRPCLLSDYLARAPEPAMTRLILLPDAALSFKEISAPASGLVLCIGPEGGFTPAEIQQLSDQGFTGARLGPRVLRTETAGPAAITAAQVLWGDLG